MWLATDPRAHINIRKVNPTRYLLANASMIYPEQQATCFASDKDLMNLTTDRN